MIAVSRFRVTQAERDAFEAVSVPAIELLRRQRGLQGLDFGLNLDDPELWVLVTRWADVGSYRRALGSTNRPILWPMLALAIDEPSAYDAPEHVGENVPRGLA